LTHLDVVALSQGELARVTALSKEALVLTRSVGELEAEVNSLSTRAQVAWQVGDLTTAMDLQRQSLALAPRPRAVHTASRKTWSSTRTYSRHSDRESRQRSF
jgi:uncharacterized membrane protein YccC